MADQRSRTAPILVVGAGPTGLTAALELGRFGIPVRVVDKLAEPLTSSRAIGIQARTLELMDQRGLAAEMVDLGNPGRGGSVYGGGKRIARLDFGHVASRFDYMLFLSQAETERILRDAVERQGIAIERGVELVAIAQASGTDNPTPVTATLRHADGRIEDVQTSWLIGAEGAHSLTRTTLDLHFEGKTLDEAYALGDLHVDGDLADSDFHIFSSEHGFMGLFPMGRGHFRLIASNPLSEPARGTAPSLDELQRIYDQRSPVAARFHDMGWSSWFRINSRMVPRLKIGRFLLGGDAAHIHSPAGAQGMNTGIQDMINLGWKLALVVQGKAPETLLDTYETDRLPVMHDVLFKTENLTALIGSENPIVRGLANHLAPYLSETDIVQENATARMSQVALGYRGSPLSADHHPGGSLQAGDRVPDLAVCSGAGAQTHLQALLDPDRFVLLASGGPVDRSVAATVERFGDLITATPISPAPDEADRDAYREAFGGDPAIVLVRPDGYVGFAGRAKTAAASLGAYLDQWLLPQSH